MGLDEGLIVGGVGIMIVVCIMSYKVLIRFSQSKVSACEVSAAGGIGSSAAIAGS